MNVASSAPGTNSGERSFRFADMGWSFGGHIGNLALLYYRNGQRCAVDHSHLSPNVPLHAGEYQKERGSWYCMTLQTILAATLVASKLRQECEYMYAHIYFLIKSKWSLRVGCGINESTDYCYYYNIRQPSVFTSVQQHVPNSLCLNPYPIQIHLSSSQLLE